jgi:ribonuclease Z
MLVGSAGGAERPVAAADGWWRGPVPVVVDQTVCMRELVVLGTASQAPTRHRNHNGYLLRWDGTGVLVDPGEGTQRQMLLAGVPASAITHICITHLHGDHCLGLPGVVQRLALDRVAGPVEVLYPASGQAHIERLLGASIFEPFTELRLRPVTEPGVVSVTPSWRLVAHPLDHRVDTFGWRIEEPDGVSLDPAALATLGLAGPLVGELSRAGAVTAPDGRRVTVADVGVPRRGQVAAFVLDSRPCDGARTLAAGADLLVCESTYAAAEARLAEDHGHMTTVDAARLAADGGVGMLVLTHFSQRYPDVQPLVDEARTIMPSTVAAVDLQRITMPPRRRGVPTTGCSEG